MTGDLVDAIDDRSARGIAAAISRLVTSGALEPGHRLPTVRDLATRLGRSPTTVSEAWQSLAAARVIETRGRAGTFVVGPPHPSGPRRYRRLTEGPGPFALDLSTGTPDPELLPDLGPALGRVSRRTLTQSYLDDPVLPELDEVLRARWPFSVEALTVVDGAMDGLDRVATEIVRLGDRVAVENPCFPPLLDLLEQLGAEVIPLDLDDEGIVAGSLRAALARGIVAVFLQPRAQNPTGWSMSATRAKRLAALVRAKNVLVVEDDHSGDIASAPAVSLGTHVPDQCVHILSFSKSHGPELRLAALGGAGDVVGRVASRRLLGPGWSSRLLQNVLVELAADGAAVAQVAAAREVYADRRARLVAALDDRGVRCTGTDGINLWFEVHDEHRALVTLAAQGIGAAPGTPFVVEPDHQDHLRITSGLVRSGHLRLADQLALAAERITVSRRRFA